MNELITITESNGKRAVSAKELYEKLGFAPQHWANWYKKNIINNTFAVENEDFIQLPLSGRTQDFALSIDFAKRLSMMARTETGEQIGRKVCNLCRQLGIEPEEIPDPRFGKVKTYPENVLKQVFNMPIN